MLQEKTLRINTKKYILFTQIQPLVKVEREAFRDFLSLQYPNVFEVYPEELLCKFPAPYKQDCVLRGSDS